eukprot:TRINITY_DN3873_c1_g1_i1.p1 TRINITY_DN3873_c1_g1~~TRINITY_DN3873_c1_g1_i1.p1  ORF type:complete len:699 (+),score=98.42 TRINITY_DN3873_c1_g1_i1:47-2143(+)
MSVIETLLAVLLLLVVEVSCLTQVPCVGGSYKDGTAKGQYLYTVTQCGLVIYDWAQPTLKHIGELGSHGTADGIALFENSVLILADEGVQIVDVSIPARPQLTSTYKTKGPVQIEVFPDLSIAVVATGVNGMDIILLNDLTNPTPLVQNYKYSGHKSTTSLKQLRPGVLLAAGTDVVAAINVTDPSDPTMMSSIATIGSVISIDAYDTQFGYLLLGSRGISVLDCSTLTNIVIAQTENTPGRSATSSAVTGDAVIVADGKQITLFEVTNGILGQASELGIDLPLLTTSSISKVVIRDGGGIGVLQGGFIFIVTTTSEGMSVETTYSMLNVISASVVSSSTLYLSDHAVDSVLVVMDITVPEQPRTLSRFLLGLGTPSASLGMIFVQSMSFIIVCTGEGELVVVNVSDGAAPLLVETIPCNCTALASLEIDGVGSFLLVADGSSVQSYSLTDFRQTAKYDFNGARSIAVSVNGTSYVAIVGSMNMGVAVFDVSDPSAVVLLWADESIPLGLPIQVAVTDNKTAVISSLNSGITLLDIRNPSDPQLLSFISLPTTMKVAVAGSMIYVATGGGFTEIELLDPRSPVVGQNVSLSGAMYFSDPPLPISYSSIGNGFLYCSLIGRLEIWHNSLPPTPLPWSGGGGPITPPHSISETDDNLVLIVILAVTIPVSLLVIAGIYLYSDKRNVRFRDETNQDLMEME